MDDGKANGPVHAIMVDLDLADTAIALIQQAKQHATPPAVIAFGSHVATDLLQAARAAGADDVLPRTRVYRQVARPVASLWGTVGSVSTGRNTCRTSRLRLSRS